jgi:hypothetical protein
MIDTSGNPPSNKAKTLEDKPFFDMLLTHRSSEVRSFCQHLLTSIMHNLFEKVGDTDYTPED